MAAAPAPAEALPPSAAQNQPATTLSPTPTPASPATGSATAATTPPASTSTTAQAPGSVKAHKTGLLKRIWKSSTGPPSPAAPAHPSPAQSAAGAGAGAPTAAISANSAPINTVERAQLAPPITSPRAGPEPTTPKQSRSSSSRPHVAALSLFRTRSPNHQATAAAASAAAAAAAATTTTTSAAAAARPATRPPSDLENQPPVVTPKPDLAALSKPTGKFQAHARTTSSSSVAQAAGVGLEAEEPFQQLASPVREPTDADPDTPVAPAASSQPTGAAQSQMLSTGSTTAARQFGEHVTSLTSPLVGASSQPSAVAYPHHNHSLPSAASNLHHSPLNAPPTESESTPSVTPALTLAPSAVPTARSGSLLAQPKPPLSAPAQQLLSAAPVIESSRRSSRADESPSPTTDRSSRILSSSPSMATSAATSPALLTPASSSGDSSGPSVLAQSKDSGKSGLSALQNRSPGSLAVPQAEKKRRSFLGIKLGSSKSNKTSPNSSPAAEDARSLGEAEASPPRAASVNRRPSRSLSVPGRSIAAIPETRPAPPLLPGQGGPSPPMSATRQASRRPDFPRPVSSKSVSASDASSASPSASQRRRRYKDTRDLSALVNELAAEEAAAAALYQHEMQMQRQPLSFASAGADLNGSIHSGQGLLVPRTASIYDSASIASGPASRNASQTSLNLATKGPFAVSRTGSVLNSPVVGTVDLSGPNAATAIAGHGRLASAGDIGAKQMQSSASSSAGHNPPLSASLPASPPPGARSRPHQHPDPANWDAASSHSQRSGLSTPSHSVSAASAAFKSRAAALGFSALDAAMTGGNGLVVDPFGFPMHSDSPFDAIRTYRSGSFGSAANAPGMLRSNDSTHSLGYSQPDLHATNASTSSFHGTSDAVSFDGTSRLTASSHSGNGQRVRRSVLTMSLYDPDAEQQGVPTAATSRTREASADSGKAGSRGVEKGSGSRLSSPFGSRVPSRTVTPKTSSKALDQAVRHEEKLRVKEEKKRIKEEKKLELHNAKRAKQLEMEMKMVPRDPRATKATKEAFAAQEAEKEKQRALAKGVDEALRRAQEAQAVALQEQYKRQQLLQKPSVNGSQPSSSHASSRPSSHHDQSGAAPAGASRANGKEGTQASDGLSTRDAPPSPGVALHGSAAAPQPNGKVSSSSAEVEAATKASPTRPPRAAGRSPSSTSLRNGGSGAVLPASQAPPLPQQGVEAGI
ncbi:hypothetical protein OC844_006043 [Tilletia horrida]|nr:hypothetical protein OC844_006043 [Tilletia horrida]